MNNKYVCIHGHFYQPPRENAWLETIESQESASPFHDWNDRINFECYAPNAAARLTDGDGGITKITNNYKRISFNIGPTLLNWIEKHDPGTYNRILEADVRSQELFNGHGSAIAQVYNHMIMPLANTRDKETQIIWGIEDFEKHFNRKPEGIWLAETAVDLETLELCEKHGIKYTILAPQQAQACRHFDQKDWQFGGVDPRRPYKCNLPNGKSISIFVYDGQVAQDVAFKGLLNNGNNLSDRLIGCLDDNDYPQLSHIATDGESYGHHHRHGEMALAACIDNINQRADVQLANYGMYLELFPPDHEVMIHEDSSWSCVHGVERWKSDCGCNTGGTGWHQKWRPGIRNILNDLRDKTIPKFEEVTAPFTDDCWAMRNDYIKVIMNRCPESLDAFLKRNCKRELTEDEKVLLFRALEMQRNAMLMFTSCAWFFDEVSGIEVNQVLQYALRVIRYTEQITDVNYFEDFVTTLKTIPSNVFEDGSVSFINNVVPSQLELRRAGIHFAIASLFTKDPENISLYNYSFEIKKYQKAHAGLQKLATGQITMRSKVTQSTKDFTFSVLYIGQQNIVGSIMKGVDDSTFDDMYHKSKAAFKGANLGKVISIMEEYFEGDRFTIWHLFRDEKKKLLQDVSKRNMQKLEIHFKEIYDENYQLMSGMQASGFPIPNAFMTAIKHILNLDFQNYFKRPQLKITELQRLAGEFKKWEVPIQEIKLVQLSASERIFHEVSTLENEMSHLVVIDKLNAIFEVLNGMDIDLDVWKSQNKYYRKLRLFRRGEAEYLSDEWKDAFLRLGRNLNVNV